MPVKPEYAKPKPKPAVDEERRDVHGGRRSGMLFGSLMGVGFTTLATTFGLWTLGTARFMFPNILTEPPSKFKVGFPSNFSPGQVETRFVAKFGVWVVNWRIQRPAGDLRPADGLHAPGLHAELAGRGAEIQMPLPRQRIL